MKRSVLAAMLIAPTIAVAKTTPRAPVTRASDPVAMNAQCETCHADIAREWRASLHHDAFTSAPYQRALAREPLPFCRGCHAPEANASSPQPDRARLGVACVTCHVAPHGEKKSPGFSSDSACAGCHEFPFPDGEKRTKTAWMQTTITEHAKSAFASTACVDCHMPRVGDHRSHRFSATRDEAFVRAAVDVSAQRTQKELTITLSASEAIGHAFPTGDLFRRVSIFAESDGVVPQVVHLGRRFAMVEEKPGVPVRVEVADDRITHDAPRIVTFPMWTKSAVRWRVVYERVEFPKDDDDAVIEGSIEIARGSL